MRDKAREHAVHISRADYEAGRDTFGGIEAGLLNGGAVAGGGAGGDGEGDEGEEDDGNVPSKSPQKVLINGRCAHLILPRSLWPLSALWVGGLGGV